MGTVCKERFSLLEINPFASSELIWNEFIHTQLLAEFILYRTPIQLFITA